MLETINEVLSKIDGIVWGVPLMVLILSGGLYLTIRMGFLQTRKLPLALKWMVKNEEDGHGEVTSFGALCTALSATIGTGNIVGVATAICAGGPGALFWMEIAAFFGMATKYAEGLLAVKYRVVDEEGHALGGPFYYIERGMGSKWKWLAMIFAFFGICVGLFGIGTFSQVNGIASAVNNFFDPNQQHTVAIPGIGTYSWTVVIASLVLSICVALVLIGGIKRIANVSQIVVPFMAIIYVVISLTLIICNITEIPAAIVTVVKGAFNPSAVTGGAVGTLFIAMQSGVARGIFSNESGLGSAPIAAAAAKTKEPVRQGLVSMTGTFIDTIIVCTITGLAIASSGVLGTTNADGKMLEGAELTIAAFETALGKAGAVFVTISIILFAFSTILGWEYNGEKALEFLFKKPIFCYIYRVVFSLLTYVGATATLGVVWSFSDIANGLMAIPNLICLIALSGSLAKETKDYHNKLKDEKVKTK